MKIKILKYLPATTKRVAQNTCYKVNRKIRDRTVDRLTAYQNCDERVLTQRIDELNREWDTERVLEARAASGVLLTSAIGYRKTKYGGFLLTGTVGLFLLQHALMGWCPPLPILRMLGVRTEEEIQNEKNVLKFMRGDFSRSSAEEMLIISEKD